MNHKKITDEEVEKEIERLSKSPLVKIGRKEVKDKYRRRQYLYQLRMCERVGREVLEAENKAAKSKKKV